MGYRAEKLKTERRIKLCKRILLIVLLTALIGLCIFSAFYPPESWKYYVNKPKVGKRRAGEMRLHFIDVGQGDCSLVEFPDGKTMLIDGGNGKESTATKILRYLNALKIDTLDYLVVSHADGDHCGGLDTVLKYKKVCSAFIPTTDPSINTEYAEFYAALVKEKCEWRYSSRSALLFEDADYDVKFIYPMTEDVENGFGAAVNTNETSSVLWMDYKGVSALFTGDAPSNVEELLLHHAQMGLLWGNIALSETEILKVSHHGSADGTSSAFLEYLNVETAVVSCGKDNIYGHPTDEVFLRLQQAEVERICRTDTDGNVIITVFADGTYTIKTAK